MTRTTGRVKSAKTSMFTGLGTAVRVQRGWVGGIPVVGSHPASHIGS
jgi:hypothetical protein